MKNRTLYLFAGLLALLVAGYLVRAKTKPKIGTPPAPAVKLCAGIEAADVGAISIWNADKRVELERAAGRWVVKSSFGHPAKDVEDFVRQFAGMQGELRSTTKNVFAAYEIEDGQGTHVEFRGKADHHLVLGRKSPGWRQAFVRRANSNDVYLVSEEIRDPLDARRWLDLDFLRLDSPKVVGITLESPGRKLVLAREAKDKEWKLVEPAMNVKLKPDAVGALSALTVTADDAADPATFGDPTMKATFKLEGGGATVVEVAGLLGRAGGPVYKLGESSVGRIFKKMKELAELAPLALDEAAITRVALDDPYKTVVLERKDGAWTSPGLELKASAAADTVKALAKLEPDDIAVPASPEDAMPPDPEYRAVISSGDAVTTVIVGRPVPGADGMRYLKIPGQAETYAAGRATLERLFPPLSEFTDLKHLDPPWKDAKQLTFRSGDVELKFVKGAAGWEASAGGFTFPVKAGHPDDVLGYNVTPADVVTKKSPGRPEFAWSDGALAIEIGPKDGDRRLVKWGDAVYRIGWSIDDLCKKPGDLVDLKPFKSLKDVKSTTLDGAAIDLEALKELEVKEIGALVAIRDVGTIVVEHAGGTLTVSIGAVGDNDAERRLAIGPVHLIVDAAAIERLKKP